MEEMKIIEAKIHSLDNRELGTVGLNGAVFGVEERGNVLHQVVVWQLAKRRAGTHLVKTRGEIAKSGKKIYRQKGTGGARHGPRSANQFRGGGVCFGPVLRSHEHKINKKVKILALKIALSLKLRRGELFILDEVKLPSAKTKDLAVTLGHFGKDRVLFVDVELDKHFVLAAKNLSKINVLPVAGLNVYDILRSDRVGLSRKSIAAIEKRLKAEQRLEL